MKSVLQSLTTRVTILLLLTAAAWSQCNNPPSPSVVICTPTNGSTVVYNNEVSVRSTPASGASITFIYVYDNNVLISKSMGTPGLNIYDGSMSNGGHNLVVYAADSDGNVYQAKSSFTVIGQGYTLCPLPSSPGVVICDPPAGAIYGLYMAAFASAKGQSAIKQLSFYLDGKFLTSQPNTSGLGVAIQLQTQGVPYTLTVTALDSSGNTYTANKTLVASYTFGQWSCFYTCAPGINVAMPQVEAYVGNTFNLVAQIVDNPKPITSMKAYLGNTLVATSSNATLQQEITDAPNGTNILTIEGWDTAGIEYYYQENININVLE